MLLQRLGLKATALLVALFVWVVVVVRRPAEQQVVVQVRPLLDDSLMLAAEPPTVRALVAGRTADLLRLRSWTPVVRHAVRTSAGDSVTLDVMPADVHLPPELQDAVRVLDVDPRRLTIRVTRRTAVRRP